MPPKMPMKSKGMRGAPKQKAKKGTMKRLLGMLFKQNKGLLIVALICITLSAATSVMSSIFLTEVVTILQEGLALINPTAEQIAQGVIALSPAQSWQAIWPKLLTVFLCMGGVFGLSVFCSFLYHRLMAIITQKFLHQTRTNVFNKMQSLPVRFFDTNRTGDVMSVYTNDIDAMRQLVSQSIPSLCSSIISIITLLVLMVRFSLWLSLVIFAGVVVMFFVTKKVGGGSAKYFMRQQISIGNLEGYVQEIMHGQKVVKVFNHEPNTKAEFDSKNEELCSDATKAHGYANILGPIMNNLGNILFVTVAFIGGVLVALNVPNVTITGVQPLINEQGFASMVAAIMAFLPISKQFTGQINQSSQQLNSIVMGLAGASRVFDLMDEQPETDDGYVTLVRAKIDENGVITETTERTGKWAWKHPHKADGTITYTELKGDIQMFDVDFGYVPDKIVLHNVTLYANPGQKIAFVGATGAGKTTITNLINRFYDIADGKIRYDGININKIKKADLRRSLGIVLQDTNLFTGTVMENIRYGRLDATDEECIEAAKLAYAHDFITRLPDGYNTMLTADGANLSQGQRQLLSIARAAVKDAPVMILDEATSSIDTRTEALVQKGTDRLMEGRTVFVIAHRLSTVQNSNVIMVLDHGNIIERGSHDELVEKRGSYYQLYTGAFELE